MRFISNLRSILIGKIIKFSINFLFTTGIFLNHRIPISKKKVSLSKQNNSSSESNVLKGESDGQRTEILSAMMTSVNLGTYESKTESF